MDDPRRQRDGADNGQSASDQDLSLMDYMTGQIPKDTSQSTPSEEARRRRGEPPSVSQYAAADAEPDVSKVSYLLGQVGVVLALCAVGLAVIGLGLAYGNIQPAGNTAMTFSLGLILVAMFCGIVFQISASDTSVVGGD